MLKFNIEVKGLREAETAMSKLHDVVKSLEPELQTVGQWLMSFLETDVFESEGGAIDAYWQPLSPNYQRQKSKKYPGRGILEASGKMRYGYQLYTSSDYALVKMADDITYAKYHQEGTDKMPQRKLVAITNQMEMQIAKRFKDSLSKRIKEAVA